MENSTTTTATTTRPANTRRNRHRSGTTREQLGAPSRMGKLGAIPSLATALKAAGEKIAQAHEARRENFRRTVEAHLAAEADAKREDMKRVQDRRRYLIREVSLATGLDPADRSEFERIEAIAEELTKLRRSPKAIGVARELRANVYDIDDLMIVNELAA